MKKTVEYKINGNTVKKEINYIPCRYIIAIIITVAEVMAMIAAVAALCYFIPYFYIAALITQIACVIKIASSDDAPEYKVPWMLIVLIIPVGGFMLYFLFYSRKLKKKFSKRLSELSIYEYQNSDGDILDELNEESPVAASQAKMMISISGSHIFKNENIKYYPSGALCFDDMIRDLEAAEKFIFLEYFIIAEGKFWNTVLDILKRKAAEGLDVRVIYDDIGCMSTLPGNYAKTLRGYGIRTAVFSRLRGNADSEFNNRSHRKILIIDGAIGYTGGINLSDEYIGATVRFGEWKDCAVRLRGRSVRELTRLFLSDYGINVKNLDGDGACFYPPLTGSVPESGYVIPFGDGPRPIYERRVAKNAIKNIINSAVKYVYISTPYLIIDNDLCTCIEGAAMRGVDVRITVPHIPDKKLVFGITRSYYKRFIDAGVHIYEYTPGFIHAKNYVADGKYAITGTVNLDYRSLAHHFENGVWLFGHRAVRDIERDLLAVMDDSDEIRLDKLKTNPLSKFIFTVIRIFAPLL